MGTKTEKDNKDEETGRGGKRVKVQIRFRKNPNLKTKKYVGQSVEGKLRESHNLREKAALQAGGTGQKMNVVLS